MAENKVEVIADSGLKESPWTDEKKNELTEFIENLRKSRESDNKK